MSTRVKGEKVKWDVEGRGRVNKRSNVDSDDNEECVGSYSVDSSQLIQIQKSTRGCP